MVLALICRRLLDICPGARAVVFFPLWDPQKDQVRGGREYLYPPQARQFANKKQYYSGLRAAWLGLRTQQDFYSLRMLHILLLSEAASWQRSQRWMP